MDAQDGAAAVALVAGGRAVLLVGLGLLRVVRMVGVLLLRLCMGGLVGRMRVGVGMLLLLLVVVGRQMRCLRIRPGCVLLLGLVVVGCGGRRS